MFSRGQVLAAASALLYAVSDVAVRAAAPCIDPYMGVVFTTTPVAVVSVALTLGRPDRRARLGRLLTGVDGRRLIIGLCVIGLALSLIANPLFIRALALGGAVVAVPSATTFVVWSSLMGLAFLGEGLDRRAVTGIVLVLGGVLVLSLGQGIDVPVGPLWYWAVPLGMGTGMGWALGMYGSRLGHAKGADTFTIMACYGLPGLTALSVMVAITGRATGFTQWLAADPAAFHSVGLLVAAGLLNLAAQACLTLAFLYEPVAKVAAINSSSVTLVAVLAWLLLGDTLNPLMFAGILTVFGGVVLVQARPETGAGPLPGPGTGEPASATPGRSTRSPSSRSTA